MTQNDRLSTENESLFLCLLAVISLRIPWVLQVQGMISEYERGKILERSRRGKRHAAQVGRVSVLSCAPYGYRYVSAWDGAGEARFEIVLEEARVVRQIFEWVGQERCSIGEVQRRLNAAHEQTRTG